MKKKPRIGILFGGRSGEHEVSLLSAAPILKAIDPKKYDVVPIGITKTRHWLAPTEARQLLAGESTPNLLQLNAGADLVHQSSAFTHHIDVIFTVLHGTFG